VFWIEPNDANTQVAVAITAMLTLIAYRFAVDSDVPKLPYLTKLDAFILMSTLLVFLSLIEVMVTTKFSNLNRAPLARAIDRRCRWIFPSVFAVASAGIFLR
jgi:cadmium resistance protein CadD (predicted permease)